MDVRQISDGFQMDVRWVANGLQTGCPRVLVGPTGIKGEKASERGEALVHMVHRMQITTCIDMSSKVHTT